MEPTSSSDEDTEASLLATIATIARQHAAKYLDREEADDLARDVMAECLAAMRAGTFAVRVSLVRFVTTMTRTRALNVLQKHKHRHAREAAFSHYIATTTHIWMSPELMLEQQTLDTLHQRMLATLPRNCRRAYVMVREERERYQAVADRLGISRLAVCSHVVTAQRHFREHLEEEGITAPPPAAGPTKRDAGAHQRNAEFTESTADQQPRNDDAHRADAPGDSVPASPDLVERSPVLAKRVRKRRRRRSPPMSRTVGTSTPLLAHVERRRDPPECRTETAAPPTANSVPPVRTYALHDGTGIPGILTGEPPARIDTARSA